MSHFLAIFCTYSVYTMHFVQIAFALIVFPCLLLAYTGQASYIMCNKDHVFDAFYRSIPGTFLTITSILFFPFFLIKISMRCSFIYGCWVIIFLYIYIYPLKIWIFFYALWKLEFANALSFSRIQMSICVHGFVS